MYEIFKKENVDESQSTNISLGEHSVFTGSCCVAVKRQITDKSSVLILQGKQGLCNLGDRVREWGAVQGLFEATGSGIT